MDAEAYHGTLTSKLKPIVTMLTEALVKDFCPAYAYLPDVSRYTGKPAWERKDDKYSRSIVDEQQLRKDVEDWLLGLEHELEDENDRQFAKMCAHMIRKNKGWVDILTKRVIRRLAQ